MFFSLVFQKFDLPIRCFYILFSRLNNRRTPEELIILHDKTNKMKLKFATTNYNLDYIKSNQNNNDVQVFDFVETLPSLLNNDRVDVTTLPPLHMYYHLGTKFWYFPLYYSFIFVIYVGFVLIRTVAQRLLNFPKGLHQSLLRQ